MMIYVAIAGVWTSLMLLALLWLSTNRCRDLERKLLIILGAAGYDDEQIARVIHGDIEIREER